MSPGDQCFRGYGRRNGERRRKSVRGCIVSQDLSVLNLVGVGAAGCWQGVCLWAGPGAASGAAPGGSSCSAAERRRHRAERRQQQHDVPREGDAARGARARPPARAARCPLLVSGVSALTCSPATVCVCVCLQVIVKKGEQELPGLTDEEKPRQRGPKRASKVRQ